MVFRFSCFRGVVKIRTRTWIGLRWSSNNLKPTVKCVCDCRKMWRCTCGVNYSRFPCKIQWSLDYLENSDISTLSLTKQLFYVVTRRTPAFSSTFLGMVSIFNRKTVTFLHWSGSQLPLEETSVNTEPLRRQFILKIPGKYGVTQNVTQNFHALVQAKKKKSCENGKWTVQIRWQNTFPDKHVKMLTIKIHIWSASMHEMSCKNKMCMQTLEFYDWFANPTERILPLP